jgi:hypothetical protein
VEWVTFSDICDDFKRKNKPPEGALMPAPPGEILERQKKGEQEIKHTEKSMLGALLDFVLRR